MPCPGACSEGLQGLDHRLGIRHRTKHAPLHLDHLKKMGVVLKRARYFISCPGLAVKSGNFQAENVRQAIIASDRVPAAAQLGLFG